MTTLARHSSMKSSAVEQEAFQQWRDAQEFSTKRAKKATPFMRCAECDRLNSANIGTTPSGVALT